MERPRGLIPCLWIDSVFVMIVFFHFGYFPGIGKTLTKFSFFIVSNPKIKSTLESSAIRTGREKVYFKSSLLNDTTISRTAVDSIH